MLELSAFSSLAQLGAGLALALTIFVEPIALRERQYREYIDRSLTALPHSSSESVKVRSNELLSELVQLDENAKRANSASKIPLGLIKISAFLNFVILILATVAPDAELSLPWVWALLAISVFPVGIGSVWLSVLARVKIGKPTR